LSGQALHAVPGKRPSSFHMKKLRWQLIIVIVTLGLVAVLLLSQQPGQQLFMPQPSAGGIYTEGLVGSISRLNPLLDMQNPADRDVDRLIYSGLISFDSHGMPKSDVAESWGTTLDGTIYNFSIRPNAKWHDGTPVTSDDVIFTIDLLKSDFSAFPADVKELWNEVKINKLNDKTLQFVLPEPFAPFLDYVTFPILPKHLLENIPVEQIPNADFNLAPIGTGPYKFDRLIVENGQISGVQLKVNEDYYLSKPLIEQIVFHYYPSSAAAYDAFEQGDVLAISQLTPDVLPSALKNAELNIYTGRLPRQSMVFLNLGNPEKEFLQDVKVRRALMLGLNRQYIVDQLLGGQAIIADSPIFPGTWSYFGDTERINYNPEAAISLLKEDGYVITAENGEVRSKDGKPLELTLLYPDNPQHEAVANQIQSDWAKIGVKANLEKVPYDTLVNDRLETHNYDAALVDINMTSSPDPDPYPFWHQSEKTGGQNYSQWDSRSASEYIEQARVTTNLENRKRLYRNFQVLFSKELPSLPLYFPVYSFGVDQQVQGVQLPPLFDSSDRFSNINDWYLVTRRILEKTATP
jgi:peptide/nickel transport system substrate-binding protein